MTFALIDNASLSAVQRVLGQIVVSNPDTINGDLVAFENLIQAIIFYDRLVCVDNYKNDLRQARASFFSFVHFIDPQDVGLERVEEQAKAESERFRPEIRAGEFYDADFRELLELLKMNMVCTWDLRSSVYYLTMKMLGQPNTPEFNKYSEISASIFSELADVKATKGRWNKDVRLVGSNGQVYEGGSQEGRGEYGGTTRALDMFIASLNWMVFKSIYYSLAAKYLRADTFLHPIRHACQVHWMRKAGAFGADFTSRLVASLSSHMASTISSIVDNGRNAAFSLDLPVFSAWLTSKAGNAGDAMAMAFDIRNDQGVQDVRGLLRDIRNAFDQEGLGEANKLIGRWEKELQKAVRNLKDLYGLDVDKGGRGSRLVKVYNSIAALGGLPQFPEISFNIPLPDFVKNNRSGGFFGMYKYIAHELVSIERLGSIRDMMAASYVFDGSPYYSPKTESPEFRWKSSFWKRPM